MSEINESMQDYAARAVKEHRWAATGVSDYPPRDPLVGQSTFFRQFRNFIKTVDHDEDHFAHVFAVEGEWGKGKSRLGHELVAQINDCSKGWFVRFWLARRAREYACGERQTAASRQAHEALLTYRENSWRRICRVRSGTNCGRRSHGGLESAR